MGSLRRKLTYANVMSTIALFIALAGTSAFAATQLAKNSVGTKQLKSNAVTAAKIKNGSVGGAKVADGSLSGADLAAGSVANANLADNAVGSTKIQEKGVLGKDVGDDTLTGGNIKESTLGTVPTATDATKLNGRQSTAFLSSAIYKKESPVEAGVDKGGETYAISEACNPNDVLLSGGPANMNATSSMVESFSTPDDLNSLTVRIRKAEPDSWNVVVLCVEQ
jgi:hypothetical protein